jgi:excinuclease ABC subunit A
VDGTYYEIDEVPALDKKLRHDIDIVVDRIVVRAGLETRLADSFRTALDHADGIAILGDGARPRRARADHVQREVRLPGVGLHHPRDRAAALLFNAPYGACPVCDGSGPSSSSTSGWSCRT